MRTEGLEGGLTRRQALLAAGGAALAALLPAAPGRAAQAAVVLDPRRARTYGALVAGLRRGGDPRYAHRRPAAAARDFARWYPGQDEAIRRHADSILDALRTRRARTGRDGAAVLAAAAQLAAVTCEPPPGPDEHPTVIAVPVSS
jgi:hypothetical protein